VLAKNCETLFFIILCKFETDSLADGLNSLFKRKVEIPRIKHGKRQTLDTLINEVALLFAKSLRDKKSLWKPRNALNYHVRRYKIMKTIMISSTVKDFKDARKILKEELKKAGYNVIISEDGSIITDSRAEIYDDCFKAVESSDFIIFLIGKRYGSLYDETNGISITRQEFRHAKNKEKQFYFFVESSVWAAYPVYKAYLEKGFPFVESSIVSDHRVLQFIEEVDKEKKWIHQFLDIPDLIKQVKLQLDIVDPDYELYYQPSKGNPSNPDGSLNFEIGFKNISKKTLFEFSIEIDFGVPILDIHYDFSRSSVNLTGGRGLSANKTSFEWRGQMLPSEGWIVFNIKSMITPNIKKIITKHSGRYISNGQIIRGTG
jgi:hypothetical protein